MSNSSSRAKKKKCEHKWITSSADNGNNGCDIWIECELCGKIKDLGTEWYSA